MPTPCPDLAELRLEAEDRLRALQKEKGASFGIDDAKSILFGPGVDSQTRLPFLLNIVDSLPASVAWPIVLCGWSMCDDTWPFRTRLLEILRRLQSEAPSRTYMDNDNTALFCGLPSKITVWRGCSRERVRGVAWTLSKETAESFAVGHRGIPVPDTVVASAIVPKEAVFFVESCRQEEELVVDSRRLSQLKVRPYPLDY